MKHRAIRFTFSMGFLTMAYPVIHRHFCHVTGSDHAYVNARIRGWLALEGALVSHGIIMCVRVSFVLLHSG